MPANSFDDIPRNFNEILRAHVQLYLTEPQKAHLWDARPVGLDGNVTTLLLTTVGRKSGELRHVPLLYVTHGDSYLVIASKGGSPEHPLWYLNLLANPECEIRVGAPPVKAHARTLGAAERDEVWSQIISKFPIYDKYQDRSGREIPVVIIELL